MAEPFTVPLRHDPAEPYQVLDRRTRALVGRVARCGSVWVALSVSGVTLDVRARFGDAVQVAWRARQEVPRG